MLYQKSEVEDAFSLFLQLVNAGKIDKKDVESIKLYRNDNVQRLLSEVFEPKANVKIFESENNIFLVPQLDNHLLSYSNAELKKRLGLDSNEQIYLFYFCIIVLLSQFFNSEDHTLAANQFVRVETIQNIMKKHISEFQSYSETQLENQTIRTMLDITGIINAWGALPEYNEKAKNIRNTKKNQIGFILHCLKFLQDEDLIILREDSEVSITDKMNLLIIRYYYHTQRKDQLLTLFK
ncbi:DUF6063 family protein [Paenibacillus sp. S33]|uniref:DUF6063 family protein n=1 Tax=Paenibacillus polymyxa TaxID=1406 RepID=UPI0019E4D615|nr:hypothetical protein H6F38_27175 [Paenibacillus sp. EKM208P]